MSSADFRGIRPPSGDPSLAYIVDLQRQFAKQQIADQVAFVDSDNEDIYGNTQQLESVLKFHDFHGEHLFAFYTDYYPTFEPDGNQVKIWLRGTNTGTAVADHSGFGNVGTTFGDPVLVDGTPLDLGYQTSGVKSTAIRMNRTVATGDSLRVTDNAALDLAASTGFSEFSRFRLFSLANDGGLSRTIYQKIDDSTPNNARMLLVRSDGSVAYIVKKAGVVTGKQTAASTVVAGTLTSPGQPYDVFTTFNNTGSVIHIYVNGVDKTLSNYTDTVTWQASTTNSDLFIFRRGFDTGGGFTYGDFYDYKAYMGKVVSQTEVTNHYANKWSISDIVFGHVMVPSYWATYTTTTPSLASFIATSFTVTSFVV